MEALVAGAVLSAVFNVLFEKLASKEVVNFFKRQKLNDKLLRKLKIKMKTVSRLLEDAEKKQNTEKAVRDWLDDLKDFAYEADDFLDEIAYNHTLVKLELEAGPTTCSGQARKLFSSLNPCKKGMGELEPRLEEIFDKLEDLLQQKDELGLEEQDGARPSSLSLQGRLTTSLIDESGVYGRHDDKEAIVKLLLSDDDACGKCLGVVPIVGMGGVGKTTLAQIAFNDSRVKEKFGKLKAWVCVSEEVNVIKLTKIILKEVGLSDCDSMTPNQLQLKLEEKVRGERILLVLDDVWKNIDWELLLLPLKSAAQGSKVLVTTREEWVLLGVRALPIYSLKELSEDDCWSLFEKLALDGRDSDADAHFKEVGRKIVRKCKGLPLATKTIGSLLCAEKRVENWETILESNMWDLNDGKIIPALRLSYHYLPSHLKQCFAYCAMFPKDFKFSKEDLILLWMAEGFIVQQKNERREMEAIGGEYFEELASRSFFHKYDAYYFIMHDLINDLAKSIAGEFCYNNVEASSGQLTERTRHLFYEAGNGEEVESLSKAEFLRTFIGSIKGVETRHVANFMSRLGLLRVLRLSGDDNSLKEEGINISYLVSSTKHLRYMRLHWVPILNLPETMPFLQTIIINCGNLTSLPNSIGEMKSLRRLSLYTIAIKSLPDSIGNLKHLRHLVLVATRIERLPESIGNLKDLRHLDLEFTCIKSLPDSIGNLKDLRHLDLRRTLIEQLPDSIGNLKDLRHLDLRRTPIERLPDSIGNLKDLRHLDLRATHIEQLPNSIGNLKDLRHLDLGKTRIERLPDSIGNLKDLRHLDLGETDIERLPESICGLYNLQELSLQYCSQLVELPAKMMDLVSLCHLHIKGTALISTLPHLGKLVKLRELADFYVGKDRGYSIAELGRLTYLQGRLALRNLQNVTDAEDGLEAKIKDKTLLESLGYEWENDDNNVDTDDGSFDRSLLQHLQPSVKVKEITIDGYRGTNFPNWLGDSSFSNIVTLVLLNCKYCTCLPPLGQLASLLYLRIELFDSISSVGAEFYGSFSSIQPFRSLEYLIFDGMSQWQEWKCCQENETEDDAFTVFPLLRELTISNCPELEMPLLERILPSTLQRLEIRGCNKIISRRMRWDFHKLSSLSDFVFGSAQDIQSFPGKILLPSSLTSIVIRDLQNLKYLDYAGLQHLTSLKRLVVKYCLNLGSIPDEGLPESLNYLYIRDCPLLAERCRKEQGEDWPKISRIQRIYIDDCEIQSTEISSGE